MSSSPILSPNSGALLHVRWLLQLRWLAVACFLALLLVSEWLYAQSVSMVSLLGVLAAAVGSNLVLQAWLRRRGQLGAGIIVSVLSLDVVVLTVLLALSNGSLNPFTSLYLIHVAVGAMVLPPRLSAGLVALSIGAYGTLFFLQPPDGHGHHLQGHLVSMWIAFAFTAPFLALALHLVRSTLSQYEAQLAQARRQSLRDQKLASLATLAAGAAHELSTPLGTIAVVARELERRLEGADPTAAEDARLIRSEVDRCATILRQLAVDAGEGTGEATAAVRLDVLLAQTCRGLPVQLQLSEALAATALEVPADLVSRALRGLVKNAVQASESVEITAHMEAGGRLRVDVRDHGVGIPPEVLVRIGEPFFTARPLGEGMGLGVFFAREVMARLGGAVSLASQPGAGTTARIHFPPGACTLGEAG